MGQIAAKMSKTGVAGYIVSFPIPEVIMGIDAFMLGAQSVNPDFKVKIVWVNTWFDPGKEADAAKALFDQGADSSSSTPTCRRRADRRGARASRLRAIDGHDQVRAEGPVTRSIDNWGPYYIQPSPGGSRRHLEVARRAWDGFKDKTVVLAPYTNMPDDVADDGQGHRGQDQLGRAPSLQGADLQAGRQLAVEAGEKLDDGDAARHELVREGYRRQVSAIGSRATSL